MTHVEASVVAEYAWPYVLSLVIHEFCDPFLVCKEGACETCTIETACADFLCSLVRIKSSGSNYRD